MMYFLRSSIAGSPPAADPRRPRRSPSRRAIVLIAVLALVVILALLGYRYADLMTEQYRAANNSVRSVQAQALAEAGVHYTALYLANPSSTGSPFDNAGVFFKQTIKDSGDGNPWQGYFSVLAPPWGDQVQNNPGQVRYGVIDEGSKININSLMKADPTGETLYQLLLGLPNMTSDVAARIVDYVDTDDQVLRQGGAESSDYSGNSPSYQARNGPLDSLDELLLVQGVTFELLYGGDLNRNGLIDPGETPPDPTNPLGWSQFLTVTGREQNVDTKYKARVNVNAGPLTDLYSALNGAVSPEMATYIVLYRAYGGKSATQSLNADGGGLQFNIQMQASGTIASDLPSGVDLSEPTKLTKITSLYALAGTMVTVPSKDKQGKSTNYLCPLNTDSGMQQFLPELLDKCTTSQDMEIPARINLLTAPEAVVRALGQILPPPKSSSSSKSGSTSGGTSGTTGQGTTPTPTGGKSTGSGGTSSGSGGTSTGSGTGSGGQSSTAKPVLSDSDIQMILSKRPALGSADANDQKYKTLAWLVTEAQLKPSQLQSLEKYVTCRSQVYRFQVVGYFDGNGPTARVEAVVDVNAGRPRIMHFRDLTNLGTGFDASLLK